LLEAYLRVADPAGKKMDSVLVSDSTMTDFLLRWSDAISTPVYQSIINDKIPAFTTDSLTRTIQPGILKELGKSCHKEKIADSKRNGKQGDTIICEAFKPTSFLGFYAAYRWVYEGDGMRASLLANAFLYSPDIGGIQLGEIPMFYIKSSDFKKSIGKNDWDLLNDIFSYVVTSRADKDYEDRYPFTK
jgi:hypothetical protein